MANKFLELAFTESVNRAQKQYYGKAQHVENAPERNALTEDEIKELIAPLHYRIAEFEAQVASQGKNPSDTTHTGPSDSL